MHPFPSSRGDGTGGTEGFKPQRVYCQLHIANTRVLTHEVWLIQTPQKPPFEQGSIARGITGRDPPNTACLLHIRFWDKSALLFDHCIIIHGPSRDRLVLRYMYIPLPGCPFRHPGLSHGAGNQTFFSRLAAQFGSFLTSTCLD
jgi:hypothetical protein